MASKKKFEFYFSDGKIHLKNRPLFWMADLYPKAIQTQQVTISIYLKVSTAMVKASKVASKKIVKSTSTSSSSALGSADCSPPFKRNGARAHAECILNATEQIAYKKYSTEVKQISALIIMSCGLGIAEQKTCSQIMQEEAFFSNFEKMYKKLCQDALVGRRVIAIPMNYLNIGTSKAKEILSGKKLRKKYSAM